MRDQQRFAATASAYDLPEPSFDADLTLVGRGTAMGELLRRYWHPVYMSDKLADLPVKVKALNEEVILFRKPSGEAGALYPRCIHRGTDLIWGRPTDDGLRCCYHGWTFEIDGTCTAQPCERDSGGKGRNTVRQPWYPVEELYGLVFVYMGPLDKKPPLPRYDLLEDIPEGMEHYADDTTIPSAGAGYMPCNWLQHHENGMDPAHVPIVHDRQFPPILAKSEQTYVFEKLPDRVRGNGLYKLGREMLDFKVEMMVPNVRVIPHPLMTAMRPDGRCDNVQWTLPKDNTETIVFTAGVKPAEFDIAANDDLYDGKTWKEMSFEEHQRHPGDFEAQAGQGPITFHSEEHLVASDKGVVFIRRMLRSALKDVAEGRDPPLAFGHDAIFIETWAGVEMGRNRDYTGSDKDEAPVAAPATAPGGDPSGRWELSLLTPMGEQKLTLDVVAAGGALSGTLSDGSDPAALFEASVTGAALAWKVKVKKPIPMTMVFDVQLAGETLSGTFKPGMFPKSKVTGQRGAAVAE